MAFQKLAVAIIHGAGIQGPGFADKMIARIQSGFKKHVGGRCSDPDSQLVFEAVHWAPVMQAKEDELWRRTRSAVKLHQMWLRTFVVNFAADAFAYQPSPRKQTVYNAIHTLVADSLKRLARRAGETAPLCVIGHSLGTIIASNFFYDLSVWPRRRLVPKPVRDWMGNTPLEMGKTLTLMYTMGCPIALWAVRFKDFGVPIKVPSEWLPDYYPDLAGEWINFYDPDDGFAFPLRPLNSEYEKAVKEDRAVNVGGLATHWNPLCHVKYFKDSTVAKPIAKSLAETWLTVNKP